MSRNAFIILIVVLCAVGVLGVLLVPEKLHEVAEEVPDASTATTTQTEEIPPRAVLPYGEVQLALGETAVVEHVRITPLRILHDSRCPSDVQCIQAGTVTVTLQIVSGMGTSTHDLSLGDFVTTEAERISFVAVEPESISTRTIPEEAYLFTFDVLQRQFEITIPEPKPLQGACYVGGCSAQLCTNTPDMASTCEYHEAYACYQDAVCERQASGECGWTQTAELSACLRASQ